MTLFQYKIFAAVFLTVAFIVLVVSVINAFQERQLAHRIEDATNHPATVPTEPCEIDKDGNLYLPKDLMACVPPNVDLGNNSLHLK